MSSCICVCDGLYKGYFRACAQELNEQLKARPVAEEQFAEWRREVGETNAAFPLTYPKRTDVIMPQWAIQVCTLSWSLMYCTRLSRFCLAARETVLLFLVWHARVVQGNTPGAPTDRTCFPVWQ